MEWNRSDTLALATYHCTRCHGAGLLTGRKRKDAPCNCVLRNIFRACYARFRECAIRDKFIPHVQLSRAGSSSTRRFQFGRKDEEYMADFCLVSQRYLSTDEYRVFRCHFLLGADWRLCCRRLKIDKGLFFHTVYRIEQRLGRIFRELRPYGLYPVDEYFGGTSEWKRERRGRKLRDRGTPIPFSGTLYLDPFELHTLDATFDEEVPPHEPEEPGPRRGPVQPPLRKAA
jgi:hypothetical protein